MPDHAHIPPAPTLFHYTTIESLAYIVSSKSIRFSRLDKVNDVDEGKSTDYPEANTMVFVTCWTSQAEERLELWSLYTHLKGVRIGFPAEMFKTKRVQLGSGYDRRSSVAWDDLSGDQKRLLSLERRKSVYAGRESSRFSKLLYAMSQIWGPNEVLYVDADQLPVKIFDQESGRYDIGNLGLRKTKQWQFEREVRFRLMAILPEHAQHIDQGKWSWADDSPKKDIQPESDIFKPEGFEKFPVFSDHLYVPLADKALNQLQITMGPNTEGAHKILAASLCQEHLEYLPEIRSSNFSLRKR